jgi:hypothetical protein
MYRHFKYNHECRAAAAVIIEEDLRTYWVQLRLLRVSLPGAWTQSCAEYNQARPNRSVYPKHTVRESAGNDPIPPSKIVPFRQGYMSAQAQVGLQPRLFAHMPYRRGRFEGGDTPAECQVSREYASSPEGSLDGQRDVWGAQNSRKPMPKKPS